MDLCAEPSTATTKGLGCLAPFFWGAPAAEGCARTTVLSMMRLFHVGVIDEMLMDTLPYSVVTPAGESLVDAVPFTVL